jgi:outer membrane protein TolC
MKLKIFKILSLVVFTSQKCYALNLDEAISEGLKNNKEIRQYNYEISSLESQKYKNLEQVFLPSVSLNYTKLNDNNYDNNTKENNIEVAYNISQLYKGSFGFYGGVKGLNYSIMDFQSKKNNFVVDAVTSYLQILEIQKTINVLRKSLEMNIEMSKQIQNKVKTGSVPPSSMYLIEVKVEQIKSDLEYQNNKLENAKIDFCTKIGTESINLVEPDFVDVNYKNIENFIYDVKQNNITINSVKNKNSATKYDLKYKVSDFLPDVSIGYKKYSSTDFSNNKMDGSKITLSMKFYLYKPGLISEVVEKTYQSRASSFQLQKTMDKKVQDAKELWSLNQYYKKTLKSKEKITKVRQMIVQEKEEDYKYGRSDISTVLDEEQKFRDSELDLVKTKFDAIINIYKMKNLSGEKLYEL